MGSSEFRYWVAAEALRRAADFWSEVTPQGTTWHETVGSALLGAIWRVAEAMRQGAIAYLAKPFNQDDLREVLGRR